jgi:hypothetical protein
MNRRTDRPAVQPPANHSRSVFSTSFLAALEQWLRNDAPHFIAVPGGGKTWAGRERPGTSSVPPASGLRQHALGPAWLSPDGPAGRGRRDRPVRGNRSKA